MSNLVAHLRAISVSGLIVGSMIFLFAFPQLVFLAVALLWVLFCLSVIYLNVYRSVNKKKEECHYD